MTVKPCEVLKVRNDDYRDDDENNQPDNNVPLNASGKVEDYLFLENGGYANEKTIGDGKDHNFVFLILDGPATFDVVKYQLYPACDYQVSHSITTVSRTTDHNGLV